MSTRTFILLFFNLMSIFTFGQFSRQKIETDSSYIEIIKNSVYHIYEETYKNKDSVWYSVHFIKDTTQLNTEGWKTKYNVYLNVWKEYNLEGELMYTRDHDNATCVVNRKLYPYHEDLEEMKSKADSLIIATYSKEFFVNNVRFDFNCSAYDEEGYVGSWIEPLKRKPSKFLFRYDVRIGESNWHLELIGLELDAKGQYIPNYDISNNYGFEDVKGQEKTFQIDKSQAIEIAKRKGLKTSNAESVSDFLHWENYKKAEFYNGQFRYYISELIDEIRNLNKHGRSTVVYKYNVYSFNPWTGDFIEKKKMKNIHSWEENSGSWTGLIPDNE